MDTKKLIIAIAVLIIGLASVEQLKKIDTRSFSLPKLLGTKQLSPTPGNRPVFDNQIKPPALSGDEEERRVQMIEKVLPSVVTVGINFTTRERDSLQFDPFGGGSPFGGNMFDPFGGGGFRRVPGKEKQVEQNIGSGFIVSTDGLIISNRHVVEQTDAKYKIRLNDGTTYDVEKIYRDPLRDLAILKITPKSPLPALALGDSDKLKLGMTTLAIGTPLGEFTNSVTSGIVSGLGRGITAGSVFQGDTEKLDNVIQTDAAISPGNSGGPLLSSRGEVIGVNTAVSGEGQNIGFAIPVNIVKTLLSEFDKRGGSFERPFIGIKYQAIDRATALKHDLTEGAYIQEVVADSPAEKAGIEPDDVITDIDGTKISGTDEQAIPKILSEKKVGQTISVTYWRNGESKTVSVTLETYR